MTSILEAFKKFEEEKARETEPPDPATAEALAEDELLRRRPRPARFPSARKLASVLVAAFALGAVVIAAAAAVSFLAARVTLVPAPTVLEPPSGDGTPQSPQIAQSPPSFTPTPADEGAVSPLTPVPLPVRVETVSLAKPMVLPEPGQPLPPPRPAMSEAHSEEREVFIRTEVNRNAANPTNTPEPAPALEPPRHIPLGPEDSVDLDALPVLSEGVRERLGLPELTVNLVRESSRTHPRPSALINLHKVEVGETIPNTNARLIAVTLDGLGIEVAGQRYFLPCR